jgi:succinate dehydrogenase / fumarate reductase membrane anchor subunit
MRTSIYSAPKPAATGGMSFELLAWYFMRISGLALVFLAIIHLVVMHITTDVAQTSYDFVAGRYSNPFWRVYDLLLLTLALVHGLNGLRVMIDDYVHHKGWRLAWQTFVAVIAVVFWLTGTMTIVTFHPGNAPLSVFFGALFHH